MSESTDRIDTWRQRLGELGVWCATEAMSSSSAARFAGSIESLGYRALWLPETLGRDPFVHAAHLLDHTTSLVLATGIANIFHREPGPMAQATNTLAEQSEGRFVLGMGVSHQPMVEGVRGLRYDRPLATMRSYLERMDASPYVARAPSEPAPRLLAALGPKMLELAAELADGAHPYWTTPEHTALARTVLGPSKLLCVEQKVVLTEDAEVARSTATAALALYADLPNYRNNWLRLGFTEEEITDREPRFLDSVVAWGSVEAVRARIQEHLDAGADHVCVQALMAGHAFQVDEDALARLVQDGNA